MLTVLLLVLASVAHPAAPPPDWTAPPPGTYPEAMAVTGVVQVSGVELRSPDDRVAAFVGGQVRGVAAPTLVGSRRMFFLSVAGTAGDGVVSFRAYHAAEDRVVDLGPDLPFAPLRPAGTASAPVVWTPLAGGGAPVWYVDPARYTGSMSVTARVSQAGVDVVEAGARVGAFVDGDLRGSAPLQSVGAFGTLALLPIYGNAGEAGAVTFRVYLPSADRAFRLAETVPLALDTRVGSAVAPLGLTVVPGPTLAGASGWRMLAPVGADATPALALGPIWTQGFPGADAAGGDPNVFRYDEPTGTYVRPGDAADPWARGTGRFVYVYADDDPTTPDLDGGFPKVLPAVGVGPSGPHTFTLTRTPGNGEAEGPGWNLLGNPFDVAVDWDAGWVRTDLSNSVYVWDPGFLGGGYRLWNGTVGSLAGGVIPPGNGFWVQATGDAPALTVPEGARVGAAGLLGRSPGLRGVALQVRSEERTELGAEVYISFQPGAAQSDAAEDAFDAWVLTPLVTDYLALGAATRPDGRLLAIDARPPLGDGDGRVDVPIVVRAVADGTDRAEVLRLTWPTVDLPDGWTATLVDTAEDREVALDSAADYVFSLAAAGTSARPSARARPSLGVEAVGSGSPAPRFLLRIAPGGAVAGEPAPADALSLAPPWPNPARGAVTVAYALAGGETVRVTLINALGQTVAVLADGPRSPGLHEVTVDVEGLAVGVYAVRLDVAGRLRTRRLTVVR